jgi:hypothetical protein
MPSDADALPEEWDILATWLPTNLDTLAREHGFMRRARGLQEPARWLRLFLMHVGGGLSLKQTVTRASELGLADVSSVALFKRLRVAEPWLQALTSHLLSAQRRNLGIWAARWSGGIRVVDATDVSKPGATGSSWRIHYSVRLPELVCDHYELTDAKGGEKLGRFPIKPKALVLADRGYSHRAGVAHVLGSGADVVVRWNHALFPLIGQDGKPFEVLPKARKLKVCEEIEWPVAFEHGGKRHNLRLCVRRKGRLATDKAQRKALRKAEKNGTKADEASLELAEYILVLTSAQTDALTTKEVLGVYRSRWQVELVFKRLKSLLDLGHVPKSRDASARAWMQAKILTSLLIERVLLEAELFSPWGDTRGD